MLEKYKFVQEFEIQASAKVLFPYLSTATGLEQWFATKVTELPDHIFNFEWDNADHLAKTAVVRTNKYIKFDFLQDDQDASAHNYIEFRLESSELTNSSFLKVTDYSEINDAEDLQSLWQGLVAQLREIVGGQLGD